VTAPPGAPTSIINGATALPPVPPSVHAPVDTTTPPPTPMSGYQSVPPPASTVALDPGSARTQYLGTVLSVTSVAVPVQAAAPGSGAAEAPGSEPSLRVGLLSPGGIRTTWIGTVSVGPGTPGTVVVSPATPTPASGLVFEEGAGPGASGSPVQIGAAVLRTAGQGTYRVDGSLRDAVAPERWRFAGLIGRFSVFTQASAAGRAWVAGPTRATATVVSSTPWGDETIQVTTPRPATLVRAEQFATGWQATVMTAPSRGARTRRQAAPVRGDGLIQAVSVPAGTSLVHFTYRPHRVLEGFVASALGFMAMVALIVWPWLRRRRRGVGARPADAR
jgi:hypothetical protein